MQGTLFQGSTVFFCCLFAFQDEEVDEHNVQITPPGFHLIFLPFADDFRNVKVEENLPRGKLKINMTLTPGLVFRKKYQT